MAGEAGKKANRLPNTANGKVKVVAAGVVIAQPPVFHVSCFPKPPSHAGEARATGPRVGRALLLSIR